MAEETRVEVHGYRELVRGSEQLFERIEEQAPERFEEVADKAASATRSRVPRHSGALAASVTSAGAREGALVGMGGSGVPYAGWIEFGGARRGRGGGIAERPYLARGRYLYPAAINAEPMLVAAGDDAARKEIKEMRWPRPTRW
jgi:phage gpG-like protein